MKVESSLLSGMDLHDALEASGIIPINCGDLIIHVPVSGIVTIHMQAFGDTRMLNVLAAKLEPSTLSQASFMEYPIEDLDVSVRTLNVLEWQGFKTTADFRNLSRREMLKFKNFGAHSLSELAHELNERSIPHALDWCHCSECAAVR